MGTWRGRGHTEQEHRGNGVVGGCCKGQEKDTEKLKRVTQSQMVIFSRRATQVQVC